MSECIVNRRSPKYRVSMFQAISIVDYFVIIDLVSSLIILPRALGPI